MVSNGLTVIPDLLKIRPDCRLKTAGHQYLVSLFVMESVQKMHTADAQEYSSVNIRNKIHGRMLSL